MAVFVALGVALASAPPVRVTVIDPAGGADITGTVTEVVSETEIRMRADDGLVFVAPIDALRITPIREGGNVS